MKKNTFWLSLSTVIVAILMAFDIGAGNSDQALVGGKIILASWCGFIMKGIE